MERGLGGEVPAPRDCRDPPHPNPLPKQRELSRAGDLGLVQFEAGAVHARGRALDAERAGDLLGPAAAIILMVVPFHFAGDGVRDAFDPRLRNIR